MEGEIGSGEGSPAEETARGSRGWEARARPSGLGAQYDFFRAPSFLSFRPPPRAPPRFSPGRWLNKVTRPKARDRRSSPGLEIKTGRGTGHGALTLILFLGLATWRKVFLTPFRVFQG